MMTKEEIYEFLKADGAKLTRAVQFISRETLEKMYEERFGCPVSDAVSDQPDLSDSSDQLSGDVPVEIRLLRFADSGWCEVLGRSYTRGLYRPASVAEFLALKSYAVEVL